MNTTRRTSKSIHETLKRLCDTVRSLDENQAKILNLLDQLLDKVFMTDRHN